MVLPVHFNLLSTKTSDIDMMPDVD